MSQLVNDQTLTNEIQFTLLEPANNGASYNSGLFTVTEVAARLNYRCNLFNTLTDIYVKSGEQHATNLQRNQDLSNAFGDMIDILDVNYSSAGQRVDGTTYYNIPTGSSVEGDALLSTTYANTSPPSLYTIDSAIPLQLNFFPAPSFSSNLGNIYVFYTSKIGLFPTDHPNGTAMPGGFPDDFTPFLKYGTLADLFSKSGETYDPVRATIFEGLFNLGVELARTWVSGTPASPVQQFQPFVGPVNG